MWTHGSQSVIPKHQQQHLTGSMLKTQMLQGPILDSLNQKLWGWAPGIRPPGGPDAPSSLRE